MTLSVIGSPPSSTTPSGGGALFIGDGSTLSGWTNNGVTTGAASGSFAGLFLATVADAHISAAVPADSFIIEFEASISAASTGRLYFGCNASGVGLAVNLTQGSAISLSVSTSFTTVNAAPYAGTTLVGTNQMSRVRVVCSKTVGGNITVTIYLNNNPEASYIVPASDIAGAFVGLQGTGTASRFNNIRVYAS